MADALQWIAVQQGARHINNYLDDFIVIGAPGSDECERGLRALVQTCQQLGVPIAEEKTAEPSTCMVFLGIEIDTSAM